MIRVIDFQTILPVWRDDLWPGRVSAIETHSAMLHSTTEHSMENFQQRVWFFGAYVDETLVGVNSGHICVDQTVRSRGLWVNSAFRGSGFGKALLQATIDKARWIKAPAIWSYPRKTSWPTYASVGFKLTSEWSKSETSEANAFCYMELD